MNEAAAAAACGAPNSAGSASGIAQQALQRGAGEAERGADQQREQGARQPDVAHDDAGRPLAVDQAGERGSAATVPPGRP